MLSRSQEDIDLCENIIKESRPDLDQAGQDSMLLKLLRRPDLQALLQRERQKADLKRKDSRENKQSPTTNEAYASQAQAAQFPLMMQQSQMALSHPSFMLGSASLDFYREIIARHLL